MFASGMGAHIEMEGILLGWKKGTMEDTTIPSIYYSGHIRQMNLSVLLSPTFDFLKYLIYFPLNQ